MVQVNWDVAGLKKVTVPLGLEPNPTKATLAGRVSVTITPLAEFPVTFTRIV